MYDLRMQEHESFPHTPAPPTGVASLMASRAFSGLTLKNPSGRNLGGNFQLFFQQSHLASRREMMTEAVCFLSWLKTAKGRAKNLLYFPQFTQLWTSCRAGLFGVPTSSTGYRFNTCSLVLFSLSLPFPTLILTFWKVLKDKQNYIGLRPAYLGPYTSQVSTKATK